MSLMCLIVSFLAQIPTAEPIEEEIIAENYDEEDRHIQSQNIEPTSSTSKEPSEHFWSERIKKRIGVTESYHGFKLCPNKYNIWHNCTLYCVNRWATGRPKPSEKYLRRYKRLLRKYPLGKDWKETYDAACGVYYFYNSSSQKVSWLPPAHPQARISNSAAIFRRQLANSNDKCNFETKNFKNTNDGEIGAQFSSFAPSKKK